MNSNDALLRMLTSHVINVTSLIDNAHVFFMVRFKEDVSNRRRFWFGRGNFREDFLLHGLKNYGAEDIELDGGDASKLEKRCNPVLQPAEISGREGFSEKTDVDDDDDDNCPVRKGVGGPTMNQIAKEDGDDDDDVERGGSGIGLNCTDVEEDVDDCDTFPMLVQGEDDVSSAFDGMRSVKPVEEDDDELSALATRTSSSVDDTLHVDDALPLPSHDLDVFPPCIGFEREEEIGDDGFGIECEKLRIPRHENNLRKKKRKKRNIDHSPDNPATSVVIDGKRMDIKPGPKAKTAAQISPVWKFFGFLEWNGVEQFQGYTICRLCLKRVSRASHTTKGMRDHLLLWHYEIWRDVGGMTELESQQQQQQFQQEQLNLKQPHGNLIVRVSPKRWQPSDRESSILAFHFQENEFPDGREYAVIANKIDRSVAVVKQWFVNQRRRGFPARRYLPPEALQGRTIIESKTTVKLS